MTLIFLHGSGCSGIVWEQQTAYFQNSLMPNLPGHPEGRAFDDVGDLAEWLVSYVKNENLKDVVLIGHSLGSAIAIQAALLDSIDIKALVLIGAGARLKVMPQLLTTLSDLAKNGEEIPDYLLSANQKIPETFRTRINASIVNNKAVSMLNDFRACDNFDVMSKLKDIKVPVQIIVGDKDQMTPVKYAAYLEDQLPNATLSIIENGTHMVFAELPDIVNKIIQDFLTSVLPKK